jgi:hypothetical protein
MTATNFVTLIKQDRTTGLEMIFSIANGDAMTVCKEDIEPFVNSSAEECMAKLMNDEPIFVRPYIFYLSEEPILCGPNLNEERWIEIYGEE